jgi:membrane fusion protein, heavy metal efflux system
MKRRTSKIAICFLAAAALASTVYLFFTHVDVPSAEESKDEELQESVVQLDPEQLLKAGIIIKTAGPGELQHVIQSSGKIVLNNKKLNHVVPSLVGTVKESLKNIGDHVSFGEIIAILESHELAEIKSAYLDSLKKGRQANANLEREKRLFEKHISSEQDYQNALTEADQAYIQVELAKQKLQSKGLTPNEIQQLGQNNSPNQHYYHLRSPMQGVIIYKNINKGELVDPSHEVFIIADLNTLGVELKVFPTDLAFVSEGLEIEVYSPNGKSTQGIVTSISPIIDEDTYSVSVNALIDNANKEWKPGMYIYANIKTKSEPVALAVPKEAIQKIENIESLFIANANNFEIRPVKTGRSDGQQVEIISGISAGELYASSNTFLLKAEHGKHDAQHMD